MCNLGTELKVNIHIGNIGQYHMKDLDFQCEFFVSSRRSQKIKKSEMIEADDDNYIAIVKTSELGVGIVKCKVTVMIPDADFSDLTRQEVKTVSTNIQISA